MDVLFLLMYYIWNKVSVMVWQNAELMKSKDEDTVRTRLVLINEEF